MGMTKFKICPECGKHNPPSLLECKFCEADLTGTKIVDSESDNTQHSSSQESFKNAEVIQIEKELVRICDCGEHNPPQARKCKACGEDISDIIPIEVEKKKSDVSSYMLKSIDGSFSTVIDKPVFVIGRDAEFKDYLADKVFVSRQHARLTIAAGKVFVENLSGTNKTFINNTEIQNGAPIAIRDGDEIGLGGKVINDHRQDKAAYFIFQVSV